ncbi:MAG: YihY/virulence factor BrkB family protein [Bacteroidales bacterium]|nr:YihY/virulence factor BrkB family protein [Bacteroidales bacterium]MDZ4203379.1 YihY/virulence factor BrkB family protein [Bacteroidales bacterium]
MNYVRRQYEKITNSSFVAVIVKISKKLILPGFDGMSFYDVMRFFFIGIERGSITMRASAVSFNFFMALFPAILFFFTLIPYLPIDGFQDSLLAILQDIIPREIYATVEDTLFDIITRPRGGLLSIGFLLTLYFATNGVNSVIEAFNQTYHTIETRSFIRQQLVSVGLVLVLSLMIIVGTSLVTLGPIVLDRLMEFGVIKGRYTVEIIIVIKWIIVVGMFLLMYSLLYFFGPATKKEFRFVSAGSILASLLTIVTSIGFNYYVSNFSRYNTLYGSIGTLLVFMLWIYFNSIILLMGFELNASILRAKRTKGRKKV